MGSVVDTLVLGLSIDVELRVLASLEAILGKDVYNLTLYFKLRAIIH